MLVGLFFNEVMLFGGIIFWAMPSARANRARCRSVAFGETSPAYPYRNFL